MSKVTEQVGTITVDSGTVVIADPCYLDSLDSSYMDAVIGATTDGMAGNVKIFTHFGEAVVSRTAFGDGRYPVFVEYREDGRVSKVIIDFEQPDIDL